MQDSGLPGLHFPVLYLVPNLLRTFFNEAFTSTTIDSLVVLKAHLASCELPL